MKKLILILTVLTAPLLGAVNQFQELKDGIEIVAKACNPTEILVNAEGWKLTAADFCKKGYNPVRISIENKSDKVIGVSDSSLQCNGIEIKHLVELFKVRQNLRPLMWWWAGTTIFTLSLVTCGAFWWICGNAKRWSVSWKGASTEVWQILQFLSSQKVKKFFLTGIVASGLGWAGVNVSTPFYWYKLRNANEQLPTVVAKALHLGSSTVPIGGQIEKIFLIPVGHRGPIEFLIFDQEHVGVLTKFQINCV